MAQHKNVFRLLKAPLTKKIDQEGVERWSVSFWELPKTKRTNKKPFIMMFPPPNITGNLHLGHALTAAVQDAMIRQRQMLGRQAIWIPGFDHAGLATQTIVEKLLWHQQKVRRRDIGREKFIELANEWKDLKRVEMRNQLDRLGLTLDRDKEYFTMDESSSLAVHAAFKQLFAEGIIYRSTKPVFWSNELQTTLSDIEVETEGGVNKYTRTGERVEKKSVPQWFINAEEMAHKAVKAVEDGSIDMIPPSYKRSWSSWLIQNGVQDWCISRQSWWGHRIPAYKLKVKADAQENWIVADDPYGASNLLGCAYEDIAQDSDVLDTWFSSSLLPLTVSGWPNVEKFTKSCEEGLFPLDVMETGFDILNYWVSKMVMTSIALTSKIPFKLILLHGMICDSEGKKMSKSRGNVIDPLDVIQGTTLENLQQSTRDLHAQGVLDQNQLEFVLDNQAKLFPKGISACGADGLRGYLLSHDIQEEVVRIQVAQIEKIRRLSNKIWNIYRFAINLIETLKDVDLDLDRDLKKFDYHKMTKLDQEVLSELAKCVKIARQSFNNTYCLHHSFNSLESFWTVHLSSNYIQKSKLVLAGQESTSEDQQLKLDILIKCLVTSTKLMHPFMPHLTEYLYQKLIDSVITRDTDHIKDAQELRFEPYPKLEEWSTLDKLFI